MRQLLFIILTITLLGDTFAQTDNKTKKEYFETGELLMTSVFDSVCNCDKVTEYYQSGKIHRTKTVKYIGFFDTQIDGADITYYENGKIMFYHYWKNEGWDGRIYSNFPSGQLGYEQYYTNNFKSGIWKFYNENGKLQKEHIYESEKTLWNSDLDFATYKYYLNGKLAYSETIAGGRKISTKIINKVHYEKLIASEPPLGQKIFMQNCAVCHSANVDIVGPKLKNVTDNRTNEWLTKFIKNGHALVKSDDKVAKELYKTWQNIQHPNFERLTDEEVQAVIDYLKTFK